MSEADERLWEGRFREMLAALLSQRLDPLASELNTFQSTFDAVCARLVDQARSSSEKEIDAIAGEIRQKFDGAEEKFKGEVQSLQRDIVRASRQARATLNIAIADIDRQRTQAGVLGATIMSASTFASRVALFVVRNGSVVGWRGIGFGSDSNDQTVALLSSPLSEHSLLADALNRRQSVSVAGDQPQGYLSFLGTHLIPGTTQTVAVPLVVRDKPAAVLYADTGDPAGLDLQPLEALLRVASMAIELLPLRRSTEPFSTELPPPRILTASLEWALPTPPAPKAESPGRDTVALSSTDEPEGTIQSAPDGNNSDGDHKGEALPSEVPAPSSNGGAEVASAPDVDGALDPVVSTDPRAHLNARRFARFLIGEIRLYQPSRVAEGCRRADLFDRLRDEIETSRKLYERHVPSQITAEFDYFYHELVSSLAEGDATKLGRNFPAPQS